MPDVDVAPVPSSAIPALHAFIADALGPGIASVRTVLAVHAKQPFSVWRVSNADGQTTGAVALLYLNESGLAAVREGRFDPHEPALEHLASRPQKTAAIFAWCFVLRGKAKAGLLQIATFLDLCGWNDCPIFTNPVTPEGMRLAGSLGFARVSDDSPLHVVY